MQTLADDTSEFQFCFTKYRERVCKTAVVIVLGRMVYFCNLHNTMSTSTQEKQNEEEKRKRTIIADSGGCSSSSSSLFSVARSDTRRGDGGRTAHRQGNRLRPMRDRNVELTIMLITLLFIKN